MTDTNAAIDLDALTEFPKFTDPESPQEIELKEIQEISAAVEAEKLRAASQPFIDHLDDAIVDGVFVVPVRGKVVIERFTSFSGNGNWLDTKVYEVIGINEETGDLRLHCLDRNYSAGSNYVKGPELGYRFKIPDARGKIGKPGRIKKIPVEGGPKGKRGNPGKPGVRRVYDTKDIIHTRLKGTAFIAPSDTKAKSGDRLQVAAPSGGQVKVTHPEKGWTETWDKNEDM